NLRLGTTAESPRIGGLESIGLKEFEVCLDEFENQARFYVIGALESDEVREFEEARKQFAPKAEDIITKSYRSRDAFALTFQPARIAALRKRLMTMVRTSEKKLR